MRMVHQPSYYTFQAHYRSHFEGQPTDSQSRYGSLMHIPKKRLWCMWCLQKEW